MSFVLINSTYLGVLAGLSVRLWINGQQLLWLKWWLLDELDETRPGHVPPSSPTPSLIFTGLTLHFSITMWTVTMSYHCMFLFNALYTETSHFSRRMDRG